MGKRPWGVMLPIALLVCLATVQAVMAEQDEREEGGPSIDDEMNADLSPAQQTAWAEEQLGQMQQTSRRVQQMLDTARRDRDIIRITCLNDKLTQINVSIRSFEERLSQHAEAVRVRDSDRANHHYRLLVILEQRVRTLRLEAEGCVGETDVVFGRTRVDVEIDDSAAPHDPTQIPDIEWVLERPPSASGYY